MLSVPKMLKFVDWFSTMSSAPFAQCNPETVQKAEAKGLVCVMMIVIALTCTA